MTIFWQGDPWYGITVDSGHHQGAASLGGKRNAEKERERDKDADRAQQKDRGTEQGVKRKRMLFLHVTFSALGSLGCSGPLFSFSACMPNI